MKMTFRWYGPKDPIPLSYIRQIPCMTGVVSAIYDLPVGEVWPYDRICALRDQVNHAGLELEVIESVPVHEDIKLGQGPVSYTHLDVYKRQGLGRTGGAGKMSAVNQVKIQLPLQQAF